MYKQQFSTRVISRRRDRAPIGQAEENNKLKIYLNKQGNKELLIKLFRIFSLKLILKLKCLQRFVFISGNFPQVRSRSYWTGQGRRRLWRDRSSSASNWTGPGSNGFWASAAKYWRGTSPSTTRTFLYPFEGDGERKTKIICLFVVSCCFC